MYGMYILANLNILACILIKYYFKRCPLASLFFPKTGYMLF